MASKNDYFIAVYTNEVKDYCDELFFSNLLALKGKNYLGIVDNTIKAGYDKKLRKLAPTAAIKKLMVPKEPKISQFQRNVCESVNALRDDFLALDKPYFLTIESDVIPPVTLLESFDKSIEQLNLTDTVAVKKWGALGALYYGGLHDPELEGLHRTHHVLSGCTVYRRELIEKYPFRYDPDLLGAFPDALICHDAGKEYTFWNNHDIVCSHEHTAHGTRISKAL